LDKHGITVIHAWGMTETSPVVTVSKLKPHLRNLPEDECYAVRARTGYAIPFVDLRVIGDHDREVPADGKSMGEIQVRGPFVTASYHNKERDPGKFTPDGWLRTGDVATIDAEGYVKICDRTKDLIKSGGEWISSVDLEGAIMGHPAVAEAAVIGVPDAKWGETVKALVVLRVGSQSTEAELIEHCRSRLSHFKCPTSVDIRDALPRTATGKLQKFKLREPYWAGYERQVN